MADKKEKRYVSDNTQLMAEWDFNKNTDKSPYDLVLGSNKKAWWICKVCGHSWEAQISKRSVRNQGCPICAKEKSKKKQNEFNAAKIKENGSVADKYPELVHDWDFVKNSKKPNDFLAGSNQIVFWKCSKCGHEWEAQIQKRAVRGQGCPVCAKEKSLSKQRELYTKRLKLEGSFADLYPELVTEWDYDKNDTTPSEYLVHSNKSVFWKCSKCGYSWKATITSRANGSGCRKCARVTGKETLLNNLIARKGSLADNNPFLASEWHPAKNGELTPNYVMENTNKSVWWLCKTCGHEWKTSIANRALGHGCPRCAAEKQRYTMSLPIKGVNDLESQCPELAAEWHPTKNGSLKPSDVARSANKKAWWLGKCGHEWEAVIGSRYLGRGCPICRKEFKVSFPEKVIFYYLHKFLSPVIVLENYKAEWLSGKELDIFIPDFNLAIEYDGENWHKDILADIEKDALCSTHNIKLLRIRESKLAPLDTSTTFVVKNCDDKDDELIAVIENIFNYISNNYHITIPYTLDLNGDRTEIYELLEMNKKAKSLSALHPDLAKEWHPTKNGNITPEYVSAHTHKKFWWLCPNGHEYDMAVKHRVEHNSNCPICSNHRVLKGFNDLMTKRPDIANEWHPTKNDNLTPYDVMEFSNKKVWWLCPNGHSYQYSIAHRTKDGRSCPICSGRQLCIGTNDLVTVNSTIAKEWHYELNGDLKPEQFTPISHKRVWWRCSNCGYEWSIMINNRYIRGNGCPKCAGKKRWDTRKRKSEE